MSAQSKVSLPVIKRLPKYYRYLNTLASEGRDKISSSELAKMMGTTASQVRQDFNCFGGYGQQGYGYAVRQLREEIGNILGLDRAHKCILLGAGNLGRAIATHITNNFAGFELIGIFDSSEAVIGQELAGLTILPADTLESFCTDEKPVMAILCIPRAAVESAVNKLYALGIRNYWNFSSYDIALHHKDAVVETVHLSDSMMTLCYRVSEQQTKS